MQGTELKLPAEVAVLLAPHLRRALDHQTRRQILRVLDRGAAPQTPKELAAAIPGTSVTAIGYHTLVLEECGCLSVTVAPSPTGALRRALLSNVSDDRFVASALQATRHLDTFGP